MLNFSEEKIFPYSTSQMFDLAIDVKSYPQFLPWCLNVRTTQHEKEKFYAELLVGFKMIRETYSCWVNYRRDQWVNVEYVKGPFKSLDNHWGFQSIDGGGAKVTFDLNFEFQSYFFQKLGAQSFHFATKKMVDAFENRAKVLYGTCE